MSAAIFYGDAKLRAELTTDEGRELKLYPDSDGIWSIGVGRNLVANGIRDDECDLMLSNDIKIAVAFLDKHLPWWRTLPPNAARVMINLCFNMGWARFSAFVNFQGFMQRHDFTGAANDLKTTAWWREVGKRGPRIVAQLETPDPAV